MNKLTKLIENIVEAKVKLALEEGNKANKAKKNAWMVKKGGGTYAKWKKGKFEDQPALANELDADDKRRARAALTGNPPPKGSSAISDMVSKANSDARKAKQDRPRKSGER